MLTSSQINIMKLVLVGHLQLVDFSSRNRPPQLDCGERCSGRLAISIAGDVRGLATLENAIDGI